MTTSLLDAGVSLMEIMRSPQAMKKWESHYLILVMLDPDPYGPPYTLLLIERP